MTPDSLYQTSWNMPDFPLRKTMIFIEDIQHDGGPQPTSPRRRAAIVALVRNPFAGLYEPDLQGAMDDLKPLGLMMTDRLIGRHGRDRTASTATERPPLPAKAANWSTPPSGMCRAVIRCEKGLERRRPSSPRR